VRERGDLPRARALLRALVEQAPDDWQVWQALADVAEDDAERLVALQRLAALASPAAPRVTQKLPEIYGQQPTDHRPPTIDHRPSTTDHRPPTGAEADQPVWSAPALRTQNSELKTESAPPPGWFRTHRLTYVAAALVGLLLIGLILVAQERLPSRAAQPTPTPPLPTAAQDAMLPTLAPTLAPAGPSITAPNAQATVLPAAPAAMPTAAPADVPTPTSAPAATAVPPTLAIGQVVEAGDWSVTVLRPDHLVALSGSVGGLAPRGRFALALVAVSNRGPAPATIPPDLLELADARGNRYPALPAASTAYLAAYERGLRGDLSMEEPLPPGGLLSVPVLFDVPPDATGLTLAVRGAPAGWGFER
jgi:hypothetical protein